MIICRGSFRRSLRLLSKMGSSWKGSSLPIFLKGFLNERKVTRRGQGGNFASMPDFGVLDQGKYVRFDFRCEHPTLEDLGSPQKT